ncbi:MAG: glycosyltransferase family 1 protein [Anaerolineales bacterium]|jgi:glycosyltransferase involved in cell wall biosynthesis
MMHKQLYPVRKCTHGQVLVNIRPLSRRLTGVERYTQQISARFSERVHFIRPRYAEGFSGHLWEQTWLANRVGRRDILWSPANTGPLSVSSQVVTIHDLSVIDHPEWFDKRFSAWYRYMLPRLSARSRLVITDSMYSKIRIMRAFRISESKIRVIPCGVDTEFFRPRTHSEQAVARRKYGLSDAYILFTGSLVRRKNLGRLISAFSKMEEAFTPLRLAIVGASGGSFRELELGETSRRVDWLGYVDDGDLPAIYSGAKAFILPSIYEGFGLTVLEAMACGVPVIAARSTALPDVVGNAGLLVNPFSVEEIARAISNLLGDADLRRALIRKGLERAQSFSWDRTAKLVWEAIMAVWES